MSNYKFRKLHDYLQNGVVKNSDPYVIAINSRSLPFGIYEPQIPRILQALFPFGNLVVTIDPTTMRWGSSYYEYRPEIKKKSDKPVSTNVFFDITYEGISAVLFCPADVLNRSPNDAEIGLDFLLIRNPLTKNEIPHHWLKCGRECWVENDKLIIKNWYKKHPSYTKAAETEVTLDECIQKHQARRRVK